MALEYGLGRNDFIEQGAKSIALGIGSIDDRAGNAKAGIADIQFAFDAEFLQGQCDLSVERHPGRGGRAGVGTARSPCGTSDRLQGLFSLVALARGKLMGELEKPLEESRSIVFATRDRKSDSPRK